MVIEHIAARDGKLLSFLRGEIGLSYHLTKRLKYQHAYRVGGQVVHTNHPVRTGDVITVTIDEAAQALPVEHGALSILYEDEAILVLDKPAGMMMHPTYHRVEGTLLNRILGYYERTGQKCAVHFVSRLDRDTFGVVLVAKNAHIHALLCAQMQEGAIEKTYHAAVYGHPGEDEGRIAKPIARMTPTSLLRCVRADGKPAVSHYRVLQRDADCALLSLRPLTGRTHQLRVHCAGEGFPILGDAQYGTEASLAYAAAHGIAGQRLCAVSLAFAHPVGGIRVAFDSRQTVTLAGPG